LTTSSSACRAGGAAQQTRYRTPVAMG
jgi:hypothetical protein